MEGILRKPYEISVWEDYSISGERTEFKERKIAVIGSNTMTALCRARTPKLVQNVNGSNKFSFVLYTKYFDEVTGDFVDNPFIKLLVNERKIKLKYGDKWFDFVIKNIEEDSEGKSYTYNLIDSYINELSKNGFNIELDSELENNQGTIEQLATEILKGTDWTVGESDVLEEKVVEPFYELTLDSEVTAVEMESLKDVEVERTFAAGDKILLFYSESLLDTDAKQFLYLGDQERVIDEDGVITNGTNYIVKTGTLPTPTSEALIIDGIRAKRIVRKELTKFVPSIGKYVTICEKEGREYYRFKENKYISPITVNNLIANGKDFLTTDGWSGAPEHSNILLPIADANTDYSKTTFTPYLKLKFTQNFLYNSGLSANSGLLTSGLVAGKEYVFRIKYGISTSNPQTTTVSGASTYSLNNDTARRLRLKVAQYTGTNGSYTPNGSVIDFNSAPTLDESGYLYIRAAATQSISYSKLIGTSERYGIFLYQNSLDNSYYYFIEDIQLFEYKEDKNGNMIKPGDTPESYVEEEYYYYDAQLNKDLEEDQIVYEHIGAIDNSISPKYDNKFEKIRSINAKESNRFNLIQSLCETFECWADFIIEHNEDGTIKTDTNGGLKKQIKFKEYIGKDNYAGFRYGINLKSIKRQLDSDDIVTKLIVRHNNNEFANNGICTIAAATENPTKESFLLNFRYYIQNGLMNQNELNNDLYFDSENSTYIGYYGKLRKYNMEMDNIATEDALLGTTILRLEASERATGAAVLSANERISNLKNTLKNYSGFTYEQVTTTYKDKLGIKEIHDYVDQINTLLITNQHNETYLNSLTTQLSAAMTRREELSTRYKELLVEKESLEETFYKKYSKYIQEGSWTSEDYIDDNLYYLDAENVLFTSSVPKVSYTIDVIELSELEDFGNYNFSIGDKTYIEDTEFFGYTYDENLVKTPYKEEVVVTEVTYDLDNPESNTIHIQNYKTQFDDLFQRITATTQTLQYASGSYNKAAAQFNPDGTIIESSLKSAMAGNNLVISNSTEQSVEWGNTGITVTNLANPNEVIRLVSGGLMMSNDGGDTWKLGITGGGISTEYLTAGQIDASKINIMSGHFPSHRWDSNGITSYKYFLSNDGIPINFDFGTFVRMDQYGIYGIKDNESFVARNLNDIKNNAQFGLTWDGFFLKSDHGDGYVRISSDNDIEVKKGNVTRVKIGQINQAKGLYGLNLYNASGLPVLTLNDEGSVWLSDVLEIGNNYGAADFFTSRVKLGKIYYDSQKKRTRVFSVEGYTKMFDEYTGDTQVDKELRLAIYDDGELYAKRAKIEGEIIATSGMIGNISVEDFSSAMSGISIISDNGLILKKGLDGSATPATMSFTPKIVGRNSVISEDGSEDYSEVVWKYSVDGVNYIKIKSTYVGSYIEIDPETFDPIIVGPFDGKCTLTSSQILGYLGNNDSLYIQASYSVNGATYFAVTVISLLEEVDLSGLDISTYTITSNYEDILKFVTSEDSIQVSPSVLEIATYDGQEDTPVLTQDRIGYNIYVLDNLPNSEYRDTIWVKINGTIPEIVYNNEEYSKGTGTIQSPFNEENGYLSYSETNYLNIYIDNFVSVSQTGTDVFSRYITDIFKTNTSLKIEAYDKNNANKILVSKVLPVNYGTSDDLASFSLNANGITAAIRNSKINFGTNGITILNGGIEIWNENDQKIFYVAEDEEGKSLIRVDNAYVSGTVYATDGSFSGTVNATDGSFNGTITSNNGNIGGILISEDGISSSDYTAGNTGFKILNNGTIEANSIKLGSSAQIEKYIRLGNTWIFNPTWLTDAAAGASQYTVEGIQVPSNSFITVQNESNNTVLNIQKDGVISVGGESGLRIDGNTQTIQSNNFNVLKGWKITPDLAEFNNVVIRGSIKSSTLEYNNGSVQTVGSLLMIKPSSSIRSFVASAPLSGDDANYDYYDVTTDSKITVRDIDFLKLSTSDLADVVFTGENTTGNTIRLKVPKSITIVPENLVGTPLINIEADEGATVMINGSGENIGSIPKTSLSVLKNSIEYTDGVNRLTQDAKLVLGVMPSDITSKTQGIFGANTYGLYAENVYLKGALISEGLATGDVSGTGKPYYSGLNTNSNVEFKDEDKLLFGTKTGKIVLWAGAQINEESNEIDIANANFKVDNLGNLYANSGYFQGTIITDATITASKIQTAVIEGHGEGTTQEALRIQNAGTGILFIDSSNTPEKMKMKLHSNEGLLLNDIPFIIQENGVKNFEVTTRGELIVPITYFSKTRTTEENILVAQPNKIGFTKYPAEFSIEGPNYNSYITYNNDRMEFYGKTTAPLMSANDNEINVYEKARFNGEMITLFGDDNYDGVQWRAVESTNGATIIGYDLYIEGR